MTPKTGHQASAPPVSQKVLMLPTAGPGLVYQLSRVGVAGALAGRQVTKVARKAETMQSCCDGAPKAPGPLAAADRGGALGEAPVHKHTGHWPGVVSLQGDPFPSGCRTTPTSPTYGTVARRQRPGSADVQFGHAARCGTPSSRRRERP